MAWKISFIPETLSSHPLWEGSLAQARHKAGNLTYEWVSKEVERKKRVRAKCPEWTDNEESFLQELEAISSPSWY